jgi:hypothetical protein
MSETRRLSGVNRTLQHGRTEVVLGGHGRVVGSTRRVRPRNAAEWACLSGRRDRRQGPPQITCARHRRRNLAECRSRRGPALGPEAADTVNWGELKLTATGLAPTSSADLTIGNPLANPLPEFAVDPAEPSIETADVSIDADEVVPEARLVPAVSAVLDVDVEVETTRDESGEVVVVDVVAADASACTALGMAIELSDDTVCALVPAVVPAAWVAAAASPATPDELVVSTGAANGAMVEAADDAPA